MTSVYEELAVLEHKLVMIIDQLRTKKIELNDRALWDAKNLLSSMKVEMRELSKSEQEKYYLPRVKQLAIELNVFDCQLKNGLSTRKPTVA